MRLCSHCWVAAMSGERALVTLEVADRLSGRTSLLLGGPDFWANGIHLNGDADQGGDGHAPARSRSCPG